MQGISPPLVVSFLFLRTTALLFPLSPSHDKFTFSFSLHHLPLSLFLCLVSVWKITTPPSPISKARLSRRFHVMLCYVLLQFLHAWSPMDDWTTVYVLISFSSAKPPQSPHFIGSDLLVDCFWRIIALSMARLWFYLFFFREGNIISFFCVCDAFSLFITNSLISRLFVWCGILDFPLGNYAVHEFGFRFCLRVFFLPVLWLRRDRISNVWKKRWKWNHRWITLFVLIIKAACIFLK